MSQTDLAQLPITDPSKWTAQELYTNLQAAVDVELWTIPLYLTSLYSIQGLDSGNQYAYPEAAKLIESVVIEEMLHLQLACNICNALGYTPKMHFPVYDAAAGIPFLKASVPPKYQDFVVKLGGLDVNQLKFFCVIELPEPPSKPDWATQTKYNSIGELYQALEIAISNLWEQLYVGNTDKQQANFTDYLNRFKAGQGFSQIVSSLDTALDAMKAIVGQGEGSGKDHEIPAQDQPPQNDSNPQDYDPSDYQADESHFTKFNRVLDLLLTNGDLPTTYPLITNPNEEQLAAQTAAQNNLNDGFRNFILQLQNGFSQAQPKQQLPDTFFSSMFNMQNLITLVWKTGAVPTFPTA